MKCIKWKHSLGQETKVLILALSQVDCKWFNFSVCFSMKKVNPSNRIPSRSKICLL